VGQIGPFTQVATSVGHTIALRPDGQVHGWGVDNYGEGRDRLGVNYTQITAGYNHNCAIKQNTEAECWGGDLYGQSSPGAGGYLQVSAGHLHTCGLKVDGTLACWGYNFYDQVADVPGGIYVQVASGHGHACAIATDDRVLCWGRNDHGQAIPPVVGGPGVSYTWDGFYPPVEDAPTLNVVKAGSAVPLKFSLGGDKGLAVIAADSPASGPLGCATLDPAGDLRPAQAAGKTALTYDPASDTYTYVWKTDKAWAGTCRYLSLQLVDGTEHRAALQFK